MRTLMLIFLMLVASMYAAVAQFTILPNAGVENSWTKLSYNNLSPFLPLKQQLAPHIGVRLNYKFKQGHTPFIGVATSRSAIAYNFSNPETGMTLYKASPDNFNLRLEGGYQFSSKPIYFKKAGMCHKKILRSEDESNVFKKNCRKYAVESSCGKYPRKLNTPQHRKKSWYVSIQPSIGAAFIPYANKDISTTTAASQTTYKYKAGNWNTALIAGTGFEFGKGYQRKFVISINYLRGIGNLDTRTIVSTEGNKSTTTYLKSSTSSWSFTAGLPITLGKKKFPAKPHAEQNKYKQEWKCGQYKPKCIKI